MRAKRPARGRTAGALALGSATLVTVVLMLQAATPANALNPFEAPTLYAFGLNYYGQLANTSGNETLAPEPNPAAVVLPNRGVLGRILPTTVSAAAAGSDHSLVLTTAGVLYAFGSNQFGELGTTSGAGFGAANPNPTAVGLPADVGSVTAIAAGAGDSLVVTSTGRLYAFGYNGSSELGMTANTHINLPTLVVFPRQPRLESRVGAQPTITAVAAGARTSYAVTSTGELYAFGANESGELGIGTAGISPSASPVRVDLPGESGPVTQVTAGSDYAFALTASGQLYGFGSNAYGQLGLPLSTTQATTPALVTIPQAQGAITQVAAGAGQTLVVTAGGQLYSFGLNSLGQLGDGSERTAGTAVPNPTPTIVQLPSGAGPVRQIAASELTSYAVTANGTLYAFGGNKFGELGTPLNDGVMPAIPGPDPVAVTFPTGVRIEAVAPAASANHALAIVSNLALATTTLVSGRVGTPYNQTVAATGGVEPYSWAATGLPHGLAISAAGEITGTPTAAGSTSVVLTVTDADGIAVSSEPITLTITAASSTNPGGSTTTTGPTNSATLAARLRSQLAPHITIGRLLQDGGYRLTLHGLGNGTIAIRWLHKTAPHGAPVLVASGTVRAHGNSVVLNLRLTVAGRHVLAHTERVTVTVAASFTPAGSTAIKVSRPLTLSRKRTT